MPLMIKHFNKLIFRIFWGEGNKATNNNFNSWRLKVIENIIADDENLKEVLSRIPQRVQSNHWVAKPMKQQYQARVHAYRVAQTFLFCREYLEKHHSILDVGCASGMFLSLLNVKNKVGVDKLGSCCEFAKQFDQLMVKGDASQLPFFDDSFDIVSRYFSD